jgi:hypothetical protein
MNKLVHKAAWLGVSGLVHFVIVPAVMLGAWFKGLGTERRLRG